MRRAQLSAYSVAVLCPYCGEPQPNADGSEMWMPEDFTKAKHKWQCVSCDQPMLVSHDTKVQFDTPEKWAAK